MGLAVYNGDLPLEYIFLISSKMILRNWELQKALVNIIIDEKAGNLN